MNRSSKALVVMLVLALSGCVGGQTGESPGEPEPGRITLDGGCQPPDCPAPTADELNAFSSLIGGGTARDVPPKGGLDEFASISDIVLLGELTGVSEGRRAYFATCTSDTGNEQSCIGVPDPSAPISYTSRVNLLVRPITIFRGELEGDAPVAVEFRWPNNEPLDRLIAAAPRGARLLLFANRVRDAEELGRSLEAAGFAAGNVAPNLSWVHEYGIGFENSDGVVDPDAFDGAAFIRLVTNTSLRDMPPLPFEAAIEAVMSSASKL